MPKDESRWSRFIKAVGLAEAIITLYQVVGGLIIAVAGNAAIFVLHHGHQISLLVAWPLALAASVSGAGLICYAVRTRLPHLWRWARAPWRVVVRVLGGLVPGGRDRLGRVRPDRRGVPGFVRFAAGPAGPDRAGEPHRPRRAADSFTSSEAGRCGRVRDPRSPRPAA